VNVGVFHESLQNRKVNKTDVISTQYTTQLHPLRLQYGLALSARLCFSSLFMSDLVY